MIGLPGLVAAKIGIAAPEVVTNITISNETSLELLARMQNVSGGSSNSEQHGCRVCVYDWAPEWGVA